MASLNKVILIGNIGKDPETRYTASGDAITNATMATSKHWVDKASGEKREATEWHRLVFYRKLAEIAQNLLKKGSMCYIEGEIKTKKWTDKQGIERYNTDIEVSELKILNRKEHQEQQQPQSSADNDDIPF